jgi:hypothetical protein
MSPTYILNKISLNEIGFRASKRLPNPLLPSRRARPRNGGAKVSVRAQQRPEPSFDKMQVMKYTKYIKVVGKYAFGVDIDSYLPLIIGAGSLLAITVFGVGGVLLVAGSVLAMLAASSLIFLSLGWLLFPLVSFFLVGALVAGVGSFLFFPVIALGAVFAAVGFLSSIAFSRLDDGLISEVMDSLDEDDSFEKEELERFDERLRRRVKRIPSQ